MPRKPTPTYCFALAVVRKDDQFLMVKERKLEEGWYLPAGQVEPGERLIDAAIRETLEEAGVPIAVEGILRVEHTPRQDGSARLRVFFLGRPVDETPPKSVPDSESLGAEWKSLTDLDDMTLRGPEVRALLQWVHQGGRVLPLDILCDETTGWL